MPYLSKTDNELRQVDKNIETYFSTYFLVALITSDKISKEKALELLEQMKENRNWRSNIIYVASKKEIESL